MRRNQNWITALTAVSTALNSAQAGYSTSTTHGTSYSSVHSPNGGIYRGHSSSLFTTRTYDGRVAADERARNQANMERLSYNQNKNFAETEQSLIKANTLFPDNIIEGDIMVKMDSGFSSKFFVVIPLGDETHEIMFIPKK